MDYFSLDTESTGLNRKIVLPIEVCFLFETPNDQKSYEEIPKFKRYIKWPYYPFELGALKMNQNIVDILNKEPGTENEQHLVVDKEEFINHLCEFFLSLGFKRESPDKENPEGYFYFNVAGKNVSYDIILMEKIPGFTKHFRPRHRIGDPNMYYVNFYKDRTFPNLATCKERGGCTDTTVAHDSDMDAWDVIVLLRKNYGEKPIE